MELVMMRRASVRYFNQCANVEGDEVNAPVSQRTP